jgi:crotonobetainyl-CoA:carnitine CoA-transferase CaiB-like acyl-CoA transferase
VIAAFQSKSLGVGPIQSIEDMAKDEHLDIRNLEPVTDPILGAVRMPQTLPVRANAETPAPAPQLGEHTRAVLSGLLGYSGEDIAKMIGSGYAAGR